MTKTTIITSQRLAIGISIDNEAKLRPWATLPIRHCFDEPRSRNIPDCQQNYTELDKVLTYLEKEDALSCESAFLEPNPYCSTKKKRNMLGFVNSYYLLVRQLLGNLDLTLLKYYKN
ncbi:hypothetical protein V1477_010149 [Vespula maculifrons]|uniref:Uncharacterized protein n=1 Tax=Vespula maculifrons TaxID=7453 RepID=A0ABD2CBT3_VESMC